MPTERLGDWLVFLIRWDQLRAAWRAAPPKRKLILQDGRPAVLSEDKTSIETVPVVLWSKIREWARTQHAWLEARPPARTRLCLTCGNPLELRKEYERAWTFSCPVCHTVEIYGKDRVGGTQGAGEKEPDQR